MVRLRKLINENKFSTIIIVDIQPEYEKNITFSIYNFFDFLFHSHYNNIYYLYNGHDTLGMCTEEELRDWIMQSYNYDDKYFDMMNQFNFYDKGYAFFRYCIDSNMENSDIVPLVKFMYENNITDSRDMEELWEKFIETHGKQNIRDLLEFSADMIYIPELMDYLKNITGKITLVGGGINECLREVIIALDALNKPYTINEKWTY